MLNLPRHLSAMHYDELHLVHGEVLFMPETPVEAIFLIERGNILVFSKAGQKLIGRTGSQRMIGLRDLLSGGQWQGIGVAEGNAILRAFDASHVAEVVKKSPDDHRELLHSLVAA